MQTHADTRTVRFIVQADVPTLNNLINDSPNTALIDALIFSYLLRADARGRLIPDLAVRVPTIADGDLSRDGKTITYRLRKGVRWHDGVPFTAHDVAFSFALARDPLTDVPDRSEYENVTKVTIVDDSTIRVSLRAPSPSAVATFFAATANDPYPILPEHARDLARDPNRAPFNARPIGTGPFVFDQWRRGDRVIVRANPAYYAGRPAIPQIDIVTIPNQESYTVALQSGEADVAVEQVALGEPSPDPARYASSAGPVEEAGYLLFNIARGPLRDERLRAALTVAIDVPALATQTLPPGGATLTATDRLPNTSGYDPSLRHPRFDPNAAARVLDRAGYQMSGTVRTLPDGSPLVLEIVATQAASSIRLATLLQAQLQTVSIASTIHEYPYALFYDSYANGGVMERGKFDISVTGWDYNGIDDRSFVYSCAARPPHGENYGGICDPVIETALARARSSVDPLTQARATSVISRRIVERSYIDVLWFSSYRVYRRRGLVGPSTSRLNQPTWNAATWRRR